MVVTEESFNQNRRIGYGAKKIFDPPPVPSSMKIETKRFGPFYAS